jgi:hypothetical protein
MIIEQNIQDQVEQLQHNKIKPMFISMSTKAYEVFAQGCSVLPSEYQGMTIIVNPYQDADIVVLSDCVSEYNREGLLQ